MSPIERSLLLAAIAISLPIAGCQTDREGIRLDLVQLYRAWRAHHDPQPSRKQVEALLARMTAQQHNDLGVLYEREGRLAQAKREYERAIAKNYRFTRAYINLGNALRKQGDYQQALWRYRQALCLEPANFEAANNFADLCAFLLVLRSEGASLLRRVAQANLDEAIERLTSCLPSAAEKMAYGLDTLGWLHHLKGANEEAAKSLQRALASASPGDKSLRATINFHLSVVYESLGRREESAAAMNEARALGFTEEK